MISLGALTLFVVTAAVYIRGWLRWSRRTNLAAFLGGLMCLYVAVASPLDTYDSVSITAHMAQHLLLMMLAPLLIHVGRPTVPLLLGLPKSLVRATAPIVWHNTPLRHVLAVVTKPPLAWLAFSISTLVWHVPSLYEAALANPVIHGLEHACFFWTGILFWWPVFHLSRGWPRWILIPYLMSADIVNTILSATFVFSDRVLYPSYLSTHLPNFSVRDDQTLAGALMWVPGSVIYLIPVVAIAMSLFQSDRRSTRLRQP